MKLKYPKKVNNKQLNHFFQSLSLNYLTKESKRKDLKVNEKMKRQKLTYKPILNDLYRLYNFITLNKRLCVLEFGCGYSSIIINKALESNKKNFKKKTKEIRQHNLFKHYSVDDDKNFIKLTKNKMPNNKTSIFYYSRNSIVKTGYQISNQYDKIPNINPDFIYIDGPDLFKINGISKGINLRNPDKMPMNSDLLCIENFLVPGTIILMDGRTSNARFLRNNFKRNWFYKYDNLNDQNIFLLNEAPIGKHNYRQLKYYGFI